ncbi:MAG: hypothetical protein SWE60_14500 [Thermodesulfobacteriota bacterium]|nr:hypothetical protein [Thermodesulfobacteriota bacterium]
MKAKKCFAILTTTALCVLTVMALSSMGADSFPASNTASTGYTCTVSRANAGLGDSYIKLTNLDGNPCFALKWFRLPKEQATDMIATAAEAMSSGQTLYVSVDIHDGIFPQIETMHLNPEASTSPVPKEKGFFQLCQMVRAKCRALL